MNFFQTFSHCLSRNLLTVGLLLVGACLSIMSDHGQSVSRPTAVGSYTDVMNKNVCENTVKGEFPTGAVVRKVGGGHSFTTNPKMIGKGLDEELSNIEWSAFDVIHFCK